MIYALYNVGSWSQFWILLLILSNRPSNYGILCVTRMPFLYLILMHRWKLSFIFESFFSPLFNLFAINNLEGEDNFPWYLIKFLNVQEKIQSRLISAKTSFQSFYSWDFTERFSIWFSWKSSVPKLFIDISDRILHINAGLGPTGAITCLLLQSFG